MFAIVSETKSGGWTEVSNLRGGVQSKASVLRKRLGYVVCRVYSYTTRAFFFPSGKSKTLLSPRSPYHSNVGRRSLGGYNNEPGSSRRCPLPAWETQANQARRFDIFLAKVDTYLYHAQDPLSADIVVDPLGSEDHLYPRLGQRSHDSLQRRSGEVGTEGLLVPPDIPRTMSRWRASISLKWRTHRNKKLRSDKSWDGVKDTPRVFRFDKYAPSRHSGDLRWYGIHGRPLHDSRYPFPSACSAPVSTSLIWSTVVQNKCKR